MKCRSGLQTPDRSGLPSASRGAGPLGATVAGPAPSSCPATGPPIAPATRMAVSTVRMRACFKGAPFRFHGAYAEVACRSVIQHCVDEVKGLDTAQIRIQE